jgi:hypothetical protein
MADAVSKLKLDFARKQMKRLLKSDEGMVAISEALGIQLAKKSGDEPNKPVVAVLVPCYHNTHPRMKHALQSLLEFTHKSGECLIYPTPLIQSSVVHWTRNELLAELIKSQKPWTHVLFCDDDIAPPADALLRMLAHEKDIVGALCTRRQDPAIPNMRLINMETGDFGEVWRWKAGNLLGGDLPANHAMGIGTGLMLISRRALMESAEAYFRCEYEKDVDGWSQEKAERVGKKRIERFDKSPNANWFRFRPAKDENSELGEDMFFCWHAKKYCGIDTYVDSAVLPKHWGEYGYDIQDYLDHRDYAINVAKANGRYIPPALLDGVMPVHDEGEIQLVG